MAITIPNTFVAGTKIEASPMNANFAEVANAVDKRGDTVTGNIAANAGVKFDGVDLSTIPNSSGTFDPLFAQVVIGSADTSGIRLDLESGTLAVREGDDSAYGPLNTGALEAKGVLTVTAGTVSAPAITTTGDTNTGLYFPAADTVSVTTGGTDRVYVDSSGRVGIGTTSPTDRLTVSGGSNGSARVNGTDNVFLKLSGAAANEKHVDFYHDNTLAFENFLDASSNFIWRTRVGGTAERMRVDSSGNLLVGTSTGSLSTLTVATSDGGAPVNTTAKNALRLRSTATAAVGAGPSILFEGQTGNTTTQYAFAAIQGLKESAAVNNYAGSLSFFTQNSGGSTSLSEWLRLTSAGALILGSGEASATPAGNTFRAPNATGTDIAGANLTIAAGNGTGTGGSGYIAFQTAPTSTTGTTANTLTERLKIYPSGVVEIPYSAENQFRLTGAGTGSMFQRFTSTGGTYIIGIDSSVGGRLTTGSPAYAFGMNVDSARSIVFGTNNTMRVQITSGGDVAIGATAKLYLDGTAATGDTYLVESAANTLDLVAGGTTFRYTTTALGPATNDAAALGVSGTAWSDLFLASGAVINFNAGDVTITHASNTLTFAGAASGYVFNDGNVGIGVTPTSIFHLRGSAPTLTLDDSGNTTTTISYRPQAASYAERGAVSWNVITGEMRVSAGASGGSFFQTFYTNGTERMRITSGGSVGIGVTPSTWSTLQGLEIGTAGNGIAGFTAGVTGTYVLSNCYYNTGQWKYAINNAASLYQIEGDTHLWKTAASGTANNNISFTDRLRLTSGGNLAIGATAKFYLDGVAATGDTHISENSSNQIYVTAGGTTALIVNGNGPSPYVYVNNSDLYLTSGKRFYLDGGSDTYMVESSANILDVYAGGQACSFQTTAFTALVDNNLNLGYSTAFRWKAVYAVNGTIQTSDARRKRDIKPSDLGSDFLRAIAPVSFLYEDMPNRRYGLIAQDIIAAANGRSLEGIITQDDDENGYYGLNYAAMVTPLVSGWQEHDSRIAALEAKIAALEARLN